MMTSIEILKIRYYEFVMIESFTVSEASRGFADLINRVHNRRKSVLLTKGGRPVARIVPVESDAKTGADLAALWELLPHLSRAEAETFGRDISLARSRFLKAKVKWE